VPSAATADMDSQPSKGSCVMVTCFPLLERWRRNLAEHPGELGLPPVKRALIASYTQPARLGTVYEARQIARSGTLMHGHPSVRQCTQSRRADRQICAGSDGKWVASTRAR
jgi:hypothetical protein